MRVLICQSGFVSGLPSGESAVAMHDLFLLKQRGYNVRLFEYTPFYIDIPLLGKALSGMSTIWSFDAYAKLKREIDEFNPDIIHFHSFFPFLSASSLYAASKSNAVIVQTIHNLKHMCAEGGFYRKKKYCDRCLRSPKWHSILLGCYRNPIATLFVYIGGRLLRYLAFEKRMIKTFIPVSDFILQSHLKVFPDKSRFSLRVNPVPTAAQKPEKFEKRDGVAFVSRVSVSKGSNIVLGLIDRLNINFHIVGDGPDLASIKEYCDKKEYQHVKFHGKVKREDVSKILNSVKCLLVPSQCGEAFSLAAAEAFSVGTPVIGSNLGGLSDLLDKSQGGLTVQSDDEECFARSVERLCLDRKKWRELSQNALSYVSFALDEKIASDRLDLVYQSALKKNDS